MTPFEKSMLLFIFGCIPARISFVLLAKYKQDWLTAMAVVALVISIGFAIIYILKLRETGQEVFGEKIWWNDLRPIHSIFYMMFAILAIYDKENAWKPLAADVTVGVVAFVLHRVLGVI